MQRRRLVIDVAVSLVLVVAAASTASRGFAGEGEDAGLVLRQIAKQELSLDDDSLVWQAGELRTFVDGEHPIPFFTGFLYAHNAPLVIFRNGSNRFTRLDPDKAMAVETGALLAPVAVRDDDTTYLALELVVEDDAYDPAGDPFTPEAGDYVLELLRAESMETDGAEEGQTAPADEDRDDPVRLNDAELPVLLVELRARSS